MIVLIRKRVLYIVLIILFAVLLSIGYWKSTQESSEATMVISKETLIQRDDVQEKQWTIIDKGQIQQEDKTTELVLEDAALQNEKTEEIKISWKKQRDRERDDLRYLLEHSNSDSVQLQAEEQLLALAKEQALEEQCVQILTAKDFDHVVVMIQDEKITALLGEGYQAEDGIIVAETLARCSGFLEEHIVVLLQEADEKKSK